MIYQIKNWRNFQHYKDRDPPWIKLHFSILSSSDWVMLDDASRVLAIASMLVASRNQGQIDGSEAGLAYLQRVAYLKRKPDLTPLIECGFLESASGCKQEQAKATTETETETDTRSAIRFPEFWEIYPNKIQKPQCLAKWKSKKYDSIADMILSHVAAAVRSDQWTKNNGQFVPNPMTYLNQERWTQAVGSAPKRSDKLALDS